MLFNLYYLILHAATAFSAWALFSSCLLNVDNNILVLFWLIQHLIWDLSLFPNDPYTNKKYKTAPKDNWGIINILWILSKNWSDHLHYIPKLYAWYHDPRSSISQVILFKS